MLVRCVRSFAVQGATGHQVVAEDSWWEETDSIVQARREYFEPAASVTVTIDGGTA